MPIHSLLSLCARQYGQLLNDYFQEYYLRYPVFFDTEKETSLSKLARKIFPAMPPIQNAQLTLQQKQQNVLVERVLALIPHEVLGRLQCPWIVMEWEKGSNQPFLWWERIIQPPRKWYHHESIRSQRQQFFTRLAQQCWDDSHGNLDAVDPALRALLMHGRSDVKHLTLTLSGETNTFVSRIEEIFHRLESFTVRGEHHFCTVDRLQPIDEMTFTSLEKCVFSNNVQDWQYSRKLTLNNFLGPARPDILSAEIDIWNIDRVTQEQLTEVASNLSRLQCLKVSSALTLTEVEQTHLMKCQALLRQLKQLRYLEFGSDFSTSFTESLLNFLFSYLPDNPSICLIHFKQLSPDSNGLLKLLKDDFPAVDFITARYLPVKIHPLLLTDKNELSPPQKKRRL